MSAHILVTGGAGYIGSILVPELLKAGHQVTVIDNFMYNQTSLLDCCHHNGLNLIRGDARDESMIGKHLKNADIIIPLACFVGAPLCEKFPTEARSINYDAIRMILKLRSKSQQILFPTTNSGYGVGEQCVHCTEETPLNPISLYSRLKADIESKLLDDGNAITLRLATVFGISPRMRIDLLVNDFTYRAVYDGFVVLYQPHYMRNYIHVRDVANTFMHCIEHFGQMRDRPYNAGLSNANISKLQLCETIKKKIPNFYFIEAEIGEDPDKRDYIVSNEKIEKTGFRAQYDLDFGIDELIKGYQVLKRNQYANI